MIHTLTTTLSENLFDFLNKESKRKDITKKSIIEKWLEYYKKNELEKQVMEWFKSRKMKYKKINNNFKNI